MVWRFLKKLKTELPHDPAIPLLGIYPEKIIIRKNTCTAAFIAALIAIAKTWNLKKPSQHMWNLKKKDTNELIYKAEIDPQT